MRTTPATDGKRIYVGGFDGRMYALDPKSGRLLWSFKTEGAKYFPEGSIQSSPTVTDGLVLFGARDFHLYALDAATGKQVWTQMVAGSWVPSTPAVHGGRVFVGSADGRALFAFDLKTGAQIWKADADNLVFSSPVVANAIVYVGSMGGTVLGYGEDDGKLVGAMYTEDRILSSPWIEDGILYVGDNDGYVYALMSGPNFP